MAANSTVKNLTGGQLTTPQTGDFFYIVDASDTTDSGAGTGKYIEIDDLDLSLMDNTTSGFISTKTGIQREIWIDAGAMVPTDTNGAVSQTEEYVTNDITVDQYLFDGTTEEYVHFKLVFPSTWNLGTVKVKVYWGAATGASGGDGVTWGISAGALADSDVIDTALGAEVTIDDTVLAVGDLHTTSASSAITIAGSPTANEMCIFQIARVVGDANDDMAEDAKLLGILLAYQESTSEPTAW